MPRREEQLALVPQGVTVLTLPEPGEPGLLTELAAAVIVVLPAAPATAVDLVRAHVVPRFARVGPGVMVRTLRLVGLDVGTAEAQLQAALRGADGVTGHVVDTGEECWARLRLRADAAATAAVAFDALEPALRGAFGSAWYGVDDETLEGLVGRLLRARGWTVALAESLHGRSGRASPDAGRRQLCLLRARLRRLLERGQADAPGRAGHGLAGARGGVRGLRGGDGARGPRPGGHRRRGLRDRHRRARRRLADEAGRDRVRGPRRRPRRPSSSVTGSTATARATRRSPRCAPWTCSAVDVSRPPEARVALAPVDNPGRPVSPRGAALQRGPCRRGSFHDGLSRACAPIHRVRGVAPLLLQLGGRGVSERPVRSFVAVLLPDGVRARLAATVAEIRPKAPTLAWVRADNLHLTLRFLGAVEPAALARAEEAMRVTALARTPFTIELGGLGSFPACGAPRVVWAGVVAGGEGLAELHAALDVALGARDMPGEGRAFHAHVTLARARERRGGARLEGLLGGRPSVRPGGGGGAPPDALRSRVPGRAVRGPRGGPVRRYVGGQLTWYPNRRGTHLLLTCRPALSRMAATWSEASRQARRPASRAGRNGGT